MILLSWDILSYSLTCGNLVTALVVLITNNDNDNISKLDEYYYKACKIF